MKQDRFDLVVLGAGSAGLTAALVARGLGASVALIERGRLGGECTWRGCVPSKTLLAAARAAAAPGRLGRFGLSLASPVDIDTAGVMAHVRSVSAAVGADESAAVLRGYGIEVIAGDACFFDPHTVEVDGRRVVGRRFVIATGSRPTVPSIPGLDGSTSLTSDTLWDRDTVPGSLAILGGGPVAVEMASAFTRLGSRVTMLVRSKLLRAEEPELVERLASVLESQGVRILLGASVERVSVRNRGVALTTGDGTLETEALLVAAGRTPVLPEGLHAAEVAIGPAGIVTDAHMRTSAHHIFAAGDVTGRYRFTHTAEREGIAAATNALLPPVIRVDWRDIVWVLFTEPELAHLGMTEEEAKASGAPGVHVRSYEFAGQDRARAESSTEGLAKYVVDGHGRLLGAHILGERAGELINEPSIVLRNRMRFSSLSAVLHPYPTFADAVKRPADAEYVGHLRSDPLVRGVLRALVGPGGDFEAEP